MPNFSSWIVRDCVISHHDLTTYNIATDPPKTFSRDSVATSACTAVTWLSKHTQQPI